MWNDGSSGTDRTRAPFTNIDILICVPGECSIEFIGLYTVRPRLSGQLGAHKNVFGL